MSRLTRDEAWQKLCEWTDGAALRSHARAVEIVMRAAAARHGLDGEEAERWAVAGLLHDADYERWPDDHPRRIVAWLRERGEAEIAHAVSAHYTRWNVPYDHPLDRALLACDEITGFVVACCLVRPDGIATLTPASVQKKLKDRRFAASVDRAEIAAGVERLGVDLDAHVQLVIDALAPHAAELGLAGRPRP
jgi:predicted hydrolase (HD superfamily)